MKKNLDAYEDADLHPEDVAKIATTLGVSEDDPLREEHHVRLLRENRAAGVLIAAVLDIGDQRRLPDAGHAGLVVDRCEHPGPEGVGVVAVERGATQAELAGVAIHREGATVAAAAAATAAAAKTERVPAKATRNAACLRGVHPSARGRIGTGMNAGTRLGWRRRGCGLG